jgi:4a-hydroxytetrahydrobiopterin dehydratase
VEAAALAKKRCVPCHGGTPRLTSDEIAALRSQVSEWEVLEERRLQRVFRFRDFAGPLALAVQIGELAESEGHHPDLHVHWGRLVVEVTTHAIKGLSENDFILAAKIDRL